jgi:hypothetical protein
MRRIDLGVGLGVGVVLWVTFGAACGTRTELADGPRPVGATTNATSTRSGAGGTTATTPIGAGGSPGRRGPGGAPTTVTTITPTGTCGVADDSPPGWSICTNATACFRNCTEYCAAHGKTCEPVCTTSRGYPNWGAEAWVKDVQACAGEGAGQAECDFRWDDVVGDAPRWRCCCQ